MGYEGNAPSNQRWRNCKSWPGILLTSIHWWWHLFSRVPRFFVFVFLKDNIFWGRAILPKVLVFELQNKNQWNMWKSFYFLCIEFIELMWYNKSLKVSSLQFYYTLWVYIIVFSLSKVKSFYQYLFFPILPFPSLIIVHFSLSMRIFLSFFLWSRSTELCKFLHELIFKKTFSYLFLEREKGKKKRKGETSMCGCLSRVPHQCRGQQPRHVSWLGIEPATLWFPGWCSNHWTSPAKASYTIFGNVNYCKNHRKL